MLTDQAAPPMGDPKAMAEQMMADLARSNPQMAMLTQMMSQRAAAAPPQDGPDPLLIEVERLTDLLAAAETTIARLRQNGRRLLAEHRAASERLADLAAAFGACGLCWGEDLRCPSCRGRGRPGMTRPDRALRARLFGCDTPTPTPTPAQPPMSAH